MSAQLRIGLLVTQHSSIALSLLFRTVMEWGNRILGEPKYAVRLVRSGQIGPSARADVGLRTHVLRGRYDYLVLAPLDVFSEHQRSHDADVRAVRRHHRKGSVIASACLGALTLAEAGLLNGREATTHWAWTATVRRRHPQVNWKPNRLICDQKDVITAGGYLAMVDLALHIIARTSSKRVAHDVGHVLLADSARQKQSVFAHRLLDPTNNDSGLHRITGWIEQHLNKAPAAGEMARFCNMSLRTFHRRFQCVYGVTPRKFVQLKRIERVQEQLRSTRMSMEQILEQVGISDIASFRRVFQRELGYSPAEYRRILSARA